MSNNELNIFEIMGEEEPGEKSPPQGSNMSVRPSDAHAWKGEGREQTVPDPFFQDVQDVIEQVFSEKRSKPNVYANTSVPDNHSRFYSQHQSYGQQTDSYASSRAPYRKGLRRLKKATGTWKSLFLEIAIVILTVVFVYNFVISISHVTGDSMNPNFCDGDRVLILRIAKGTIEKGDVIVFETAQGEKLMKRVVATQGDTVDISKSKGGLYINGQPAEENNIYTVTSIVDENVKYPLSVTEDCYFVLGDNRINSTDSRDSRIGLVKKKDVIGKVILNIRGT